MQVETFECQETASEPLECSEEAIKIIGDLGLSGQQKLISKRESETKQVERCPYRQIRGDERFVYHQLCPRETDLKSFSECPVPLRVLQVIAHAESLGLFKLFRVWSAEGAVKDPVVLAYEEEETYKSSNVPYILARWGEELDEWAILVEKAVAKWREKAIAALVKIQSQVKGDLEALESKGIGIDQAMNRDIPSYYGY